jgi:hypothetical protein
LSQPFVTNCCPLHAKEIKAIKKNTVNLNVWKT